jgi:hypothetical protein
MCATTFHNGKALLVVIENSSMVASAQRVCGSAGGRVGVKDTRSPERQASGRRTIVARGAIA